MRNILKYPITKDEVLKYITSLDEPVKKTHTNDSSVGDMRPSYHELLKELVDQHWDTMIFTNEYLLKKEPKLSLRQVVVDVILSPIETKAKLMGIVDPKDEIDWDTIPDNDLAEMLAQHLNNK
jgi:hypothetical protein